MNKTSFIFPLLTLLLLVISCAQSEAQDADTTMDIRDYEPVSTLVVPEHPVTSAKYPFIDVHSHQWGMPTQDLTYTAAQMDSLNMAVMVNLSGSYGERLKQMVDNARENAPGRFIVFANLNFEGIGGPGWTERAVAQLREDYDNGARGLKIFKNLGLEVYDVNGERVHVDDPQLDPVWALCGDLGIPVLIHTGEPAIFWAPIDRYDERWIEMINFPDRYRGDSSRFPSWEEVMSEQWNTFRKHPETNFIDAHLGWMGNDLGRLGRLLDELPNVYTEIAAVLAELGRQPRFAREWFIKYQDRVMFGKDSWEPENYNVYFRVLETADEYFDYYRKRHAFWKMYGLNLPDEVLQKLYFRNALRLIPDIDATPFASYGVAME